MHKGHRRRGQLGLCWLCLLLSSALVGCKPRLPEGVFYCERDLDCPPDQSCRGALCYAASTSSQIIPDGGTAPSQTDAGMTSPDAGRDAGPVSADAGHTDKDAGQTDAGREAPARDAAAHASLDAGASVPTCEPGFEPVDGRCSDIDECAAHSDDCSATPAADCVNDPGSFHCVCPTGFEGDGKGAGGCTDIVECTTGAHECDTAPNACINLPGSYRCACPSGYEGDGRGAQGCVDRDDCANDPCGSGAAGCTDNGPNSYVCACQQGYTGAGTQQCTDIDECTQSFTCDVVYPCINRAPGYTCLGQFADWRMPDVEAGSLTAPSYSESPDGLTIRDNVTRLVWQARPPRSYASCAAAQGCTWYEAVQYCETLALAGHTDWRLPSKIELESILDLTHTNPASSPIFGGYSTYFWTSQPHPNRRDSSWLVYFSYGETVTFTNDSVWSARCVRAGQ